MAGLRRGRGVLKNEAKRLCRGHSSRTGLPCKHHAMIGGFVCQSHGGASPQVKAAAKQRMRDVLAEAMDPDRSLREMARVAFSNVQELYGADGKLLPINQWPEDAARAVKSIEVVRGNLDKGDGKLDDVVKITLWEKPKTLDSALRKHGHLVEKVDVTVSSRAARIIAARERLDGKR